MAGAKYYMFVLLLWFGCFALANTLEYVMVGGDDWDNIAFNMNWQSWAIVGGIATAVTLSTIPILGRLSGTVVMMSVIGVVIYQFRDLFLFIYPTLFPGAWDYVAWIIRFVILAIFVVPIIMQIISQMGSNVSR